MKTRYLIAVAALLMAVVGMTIAQPPKVGLPPGPPAPGALPIPTELTTPPLAQGKPAERKPEDMTIEQLLDAVEKFREQKAEIEKKEKAYMKVVHQKAGKLKERINSLDGGTPPTPPPPISPTSIPPSGPTFPPAPGS